MDKYWYGTFMEKLNGLMREKNLNKNCLAKETGIPQSTISSWFNGTNSYPKTDTLLKLSDYFDVSLDWLVGRSECREVERKFEYELNTEPTYKRIMELVELLYKHGIVIAQDPCIAGSYDDACEAEFGGATPEIMAVRDELLVYAIRKFYYYRTVLSDEMYQNSVKLDVLDKLSGKRIIRLSPEKIYEISEGFKKQNGNDVMKLDLSELWEALRAEEERAEGTQGEKGEDKPDNA